MNRREAAPAEDFAKRLRFSPRVQKRRCVGTAACRPIRCPTYSASALSTIRMVAHTVMESIEFSDAFK